MHCNPPPRRDPVPRPARREPAHARREVIERLGAMRRSSSAEIDLFVGVLDVD
jgi:hypothetical protein